jgi:hypothetical protein
VRRKKYQPVLGDVHHLPDGLSHLSSDLDSVRAGGRGKEAVRQKMNTYRDSHIVSKNPLAAITGGCAR